MKRKVLTKGWFKRWFGFTFIKPYKFIEKETENSDKAKRQSISTIVVLGGLVVIVFISKNFTPVQQARYIPLQIEQNNFYLEYLNRKPQLVAGLRMRPLIHPNQGAFFQLSKPQKIKVSMIDVNFPLEVFTLDSDFVVLEKKVLMPGDEKYSFDKPAKYFVEIPFLDSERVLPGMQAVEFKSPQRIYKKTFVEVKEL